LAVPRQNASTLERGDDVAEIAAGVTKEKRPPVLAVLNGERGIGVAVLVQGTWAVAAMVA
jgi:hypothetical protein